MAGIDDISIVSPTYNIYKLGRLFKIVKFKNTVCTVKSVVDKPSKLECNHYSDKLACSLSRTRRVILEKALCNPWTWFCTFTVDKDKFDRDDLAVFQKAFTQFIRDERKRGFQIAYLLVPELHKDMQNWHMHGFLYLLRNGAKMATRCLINWFLVVFIPGQDIIINSAFVA